MTPGVIGLGSMGFGAAASLVRAGFATHGYDVVPAARDRFADAGGILVDSPADLAAACDLIAVFVVNADQIEQVVFGSGLVDAAAPGTVFILSATIPPTRAEDFGRRLAAAGMLPVDAPVSGGAAKAAAGAMTIMASGQNAAFDRAGPVLDAIATRVFRLGEAPGEGSRMKLVNQHLAGIHIAAAAEALVLAIGMGLDPHQVLDTIRDCAGTSWMFENRGPHIADGDYTPLSAVDIFVKDLGIVVEEAARVGLDPAVAARALEQFRAAAAAGWGRDDDSAVAKVYARDAGIGLPEKARA
jgi:3-hydroxyisobutyrate dehydrogenase-like beta-hydroxyacid dehydrogenase